MTTDSLSPSNMGDPARGTPRYMRVCLLARICSMAARAALFSLPKVAVSTVFCFLENQSNGVLLRKCRTPVTDLPLSAS